jgi:2-keto-4-pentenoate hydratase
MEIAPWSPAAMAKKRSFQQVIATQKLNGGVVIGRERISPSAIDLRYEGAVVEVDGEVVGTGTGAEVMGDPINVVVVIANNMAKYGVELKAGMLIMTGSVAEPFAAESTIKNARVTFTRMGSVRAQFVRR